jgi:hypothetical protein
MSWCTQISNIEFSYKKLSERFINLWIIYGHTLLKLSRFYTNIMHKNMLPHQFVYFLSNLDIIIIIMW